MSFCGPWDYQSVTFSVEWGMLPQAVNIFHLFRVLVLQKSSEILLYVLRGTRTLPQGCTVVFCPLLPCLCIPSLPWSTTIWTCPLESGKVMEAESIPYKREAGDTERLCCPGAPQVSAWFHWEWRHCPLTALRWEKALYSWSWEKAYLYLGDWKWESNMRLER